MSENYDTAVRLIDEGAKQKKSASRVADVIRQPVADALKQFVRDPEFADAVVAKGENGFSDCLTEIVKGVGARSTSPPRRTDGKKSCPAGRPSAKSKLFRTPISSRLKSLPMIRRPSRRRYLSTSMICLTEAARNGDRSKITLRRS